MKRQGSGGAPEEQGRLAQSQEGPLLQALASAWVKHLCFLSQAHRQGQGRWDHSGLGQHTEALQMVTGALRQQQENSAHTDPTTCAEGERAGSSGPSFQLELRNPIPGPCGCVCWSRSCLREVLCSPNHVAPPQPWPPPRRAISSARRQPSLGRVSVSVCSCSAPWCIHLVSFL